MLRDGIDIVSSAELSRATGISSEQIRKDLAYFGAFGTRGVGYSTDVLAERIRDILGLYAPIPVALVGVGNLGTALVRHNRSQNQMTRITAIFDHDPNKVGLEIAGLTVMSMEQLPTVVREQQIKVAILAVPAEAAEHVADQLEKVGVKAVLNFSQAKINSSMVVHNIDLTVELQTLAYYINPR